MVAKELERMAVYGSIWQYMAVYGSLWQYMAAYGSLWQKWQCACRVNRYVKVHGKTMIIKMSKKTRHRMASKCFRYVRHLVYSVSKCVGKVCVS